MKKLCVFPNDPIVAYYNKGEIKDRYFNPNNYFDEVHIISFINKDIDADKVKNIAGKAILQIHSVGKINFLKRKKYLKSILDLVKEINPDAIRAYNPFLEGWFAAKCSKELKIPFFLSLHTQYDFNRKLAKKSNFKKFLGLKYMEKFIEPFVLKNADKITIVFKIIEPYVTKHGGIKPELLYNRIDYEKFTNANQMDNFSHPLIISVGNLIREKNHECLIKAMKNLEAYCVIIGKGIQYEKLEKLIHEQGLQNRIKIIESVPHNEIQKYYKSADVFALAFNPELEGLPMPVMEAMASSLPIVIPYPKKGFSDGLEGIALFSDRTPKSFHNNIQKILKDRNLQTELAKKSKDKAKDFDATKIEKREAEIYATLIAKNETLR